MEELNVYASWGSYPKIYALGHRALEELLLDPVIVEEKVDGSQFSFGIFDGELKVRSKGAIINMVAPEKMFIKACETVQNIGAGLTEGWTYRGEYLAKPKHNTLLYDRIPDQHIIIFDINIGDQCYLSWNDKKKEAARLGLEVVPKMFEGTISTPHQFREMLSNISCLGGQKVEGVVVKNYKRFGLDKKALMGKFVSEEFKEVHSKAWKESNPKGKDVIQGMVDKYKTEARWHKAVQHLGEEGLLDVSPKDIGLLMKEVQLDTLDECSADIKEDLFKWAWPKVRRSLVGGLPEWYKEQLLKKQFEDDN